MATVTVEGYEVEVATCRLANPLFGDHRPLCLDCAAAMGGRRIGLPKKERGQPCPSCLEQARETDADERTRAANQEALGEFADAHPEAYVPDRLGW